MKREFISKELTWMVFYDTQYHEGHLTLLTTWRSLNHTQHRTRAVSLITCSWSFFSRCLRGYIWIIIHTCPYICLQEYLLFPVRSPGLFGQYRCNPHQHSTELSIQKTGSRRSVVVFPTTHQSYLHVNKRLISYIKTWCYIAFTCYKRNSSL